MSELCDPPALGHRPEFKTGSERIFESEVWKTTGLFGTQYDVAFLGSPSHPPPRQRYFLKSVDS